MKWFVPTYFLLLMAGNVALSKDNKDGDVEPSEEGNPQFDETTEKNLAQDGNRLGEEADNKISDIGGDEMRQGDNTTPEKGSDDDPDQMPESKKGKAEGDDSKDGNVEPEPKKQKKQDDDVKKKPGVDDEGKEDKVKYHKGMKNNGKDYNDLAYNTSNNMNIWSLDDETPFDNEKESLEKYNMNGFYGNSSDFDFTGLKPLNIGRMMLILRPRNIIRSYVVWKNKKEVVEETWKKGANEPTGAATGVSKLGVGVASSTSEASREIDWL